MERNELQGFLASVRRKSLIDYLDPLGETAAEALARRIRWAEMKQDDPSVADEVHFLLEYRSDLAEVLERESALQQDAEDDWVEAEDLSERPDPGVWMISSPMREFMDGTPDLADSPTEEEEIHPDSLATNITRWEDLTPVEAVMRDSGDLAGYLGGKPTYSPPTDDPAPERQGGPEGPAHETPPPAPMGEHVPPAEPGLSASVAVVLVIATLVVAVISAVALSVPSTDAPPQTPARSPAHAPSR